MSDCLNAKQVRDPQRSKRCLQSQAEVLPGATAASGAWHFCGGHAQPASEQHFGISEAVRFVRSLRSSACIAAAVPWSRCLSPCGMVCLPLDWEKSGKVKRWCGFPAFPLIAGAFSPAPEESEGKHERRLGRFDCKRVAGTNKKGMKWGFTLLCWAKIVLESLEDHLEGFHRASEVFLGVVWATWEKAGKSLHRHPLACILELPCSRCPSLAHQIAPGGVCHLPGWRSTPQFGGTRRAGCRGCAESSGWGFWTYPEQTFTCRAPPQTKVVQAGRPMGLLSSGWCVLTGGYVSWDEREGSGNSHYSPACWAFWSQWRSHAGRFRVYLQEKNTTAAIDPSRLAGAFRR